MIRIVINHEFGALLVKHLPGGQPLSGKSMSKILQSVRNDYFETCEKQREEKSTNDKVNFKTNTLLQSWYPAEWEVLMIYGNASPRSKAAFDAKYVTYI